MSELVRAVHSDGLRPITTRGVMLSIAGAAVACLWSYAAPAALAQSSVTQDQQRFKALQSISYEFGSKFTSGYFEARDGACLITLMVIEKSPEDQPLRFTAARLRLALNPGQIAGLDSEEGRSLNFTCGEGAATLLVDVGERDRLVALQALTVQKAAADLQREAPAKLP